MCTRERLFFSPLEKKKIWDIQTTKFNLPKFSLLSSATWAQHNHVARNIRITRIIRCFDEEKKYRSLRLRHNQVKLKYTKLGEIVLFSSMHYIKIYLYKKRNKIKNLVKTRGHHANNWIGTRN